MGWSYKSIKRQKYNTMKYLKLYENYNKYYTNISQEEYEGCYDIDNFTDVEINTIKDIINNFDINSKLEKIYNSFIRLKIKKKEIDISKIKDEWFLIEVRNINNLDRDPDFLFKSDQFEGLIFLIRRIISDII